MHLLTLTFITVASTIGQARETHHADQNAETPRHLHQEIQIPKVKKAVAPTISSAHVGQHITLEFTVNEAGRAESIESLDTRFQIKRMEIAAKMETILPDWEFVPAKNAQGEPIPMRVRMPVIVTRDRLEVEGVFSQISGSNPLTKG